MNRSRKERRIRDQRLLDTLESAEQSPYQGIVWRSVKQGRDPLTCWRSGGRWDDGTLDVLYTSEDRDTAIAERRYHLYQGQPIPPSNASYELFELKVSLEAVVRFPDLEVLASTGLDPAHYGRMSYLQRQTEHPRSQEIAEACAFLGADGLLVPSARRTPSKNLIVFCEQDTRITKEIVRRHGIMDFGRGFDPSR